MAGKSQKQLCNISDNTQGKKGSENSYSLHSVGKKQLPLDHQFRTSRANQNIYKKSFIPNASQALCSLKLYGAVRTLKNLLLFTLEEAKRKFPLWLAIKLIKSNLPRRTRPQITGRCFKSPRKVIVEANPGAVVVNKSIHPANQASQGSSQPGS